ncbi:MAG: hypothetical protein ACP5SD_08490, partial [Elusimicrobiales bacterium]
MKLMISVVLFSFLNAYSLEFINKKEFENIKSNISMPETNVSPKTLSNNYGIAEISKPHLIANA